MSIYKKLLILFLSLSLLPMLVIGIWSFYTSRESLEKAILRKLEGIASLKVENIEAYFNERRGDVQTAQISFILKENLPILNRLIGDITSPDYIKARATVDKFLKTYEVAYRYFDIMLINPDGIVVYSSNEEHSTFQLGKPLFESMWVVFEKGRKVTSFSDVYRDKIRPEQFLMTVTAPIHDSEGKFIGEIAFEINMNIIYTLIHDRTGLGATGETLIGKKTADGAIFLNPLLDDPDAALKRKVRRGDKEGAPLLNALYEEEGAGFAIDYTGEEVISAWRYIPSLDWGMVVKMDVKEALEPVAELRNRIIILLIASFFIGVIIILLITRTITRPIILLTNVAKRINEGDLSVRAKITSRDEIGKLEQYFNKMTEDLITANISLEQRVKDRTAQLETANKDLEGFSYSVSHDLRTPLRAIDGFSSILLNEYSDKVDDEGKRLLKIVRESTDRMGRLIDDILAFSRVGRKEMERVDIDMERLVKGVIEELKMTIAERNVRFELKPLPSVRGDMAMIRQVFVNLISNAIKFTRGRDEAVIEVGTREEEPEYRGKEEGEKRRTGERENIYYIKDNGVGFDMQYVNKLFGVFNRLHGAEYEGTGIGLAIVKRIIAKHGGRVWAEGKVGEGAVFYFTIPSFG
jgi:signal transduction histidine kinase